MLGTTPIQSALPRLCWSPQLRFAAGECTGGVHGQRVLPGNSLLDCLVFGRLAAKSACKYIFGEDDEFRPCPFLPEETQADKFTKKRSLGECYLS